MSIIFRNYFSWYCAVVFALGKKEAIHPVSVAVYRNSTNASVLLFDLFSIPESRIKTERPHSLFKKKILTWHPARHQVRSKASGKLLGRQNRAASNIMTKQLCALRAEHWFLNFSNGKPHFCWVWNLKHCRTIKFVSSSLAVHMHMPHTSLILCLPSSFIYCKCIPAWRFLGYERTCLF